MRAFYESIRENDESIVGRNGNHVFNAHFHRNIEIFIVKKGKYTLLRNGETATISDGELAFFDSYDIHAYQKNHSKDIDDCVLILPFSSAKKFNALKKNNVIKNFIVKDSRLVEQILSIVDNFLNDGISKSVKLSASELILSLIYEKLLFTERTEKYNHELIRNLLIYANENFKENLSLSSASKVLGYTEAHLSRTFHKYFNTSFPSYVNSLRLEYIAAEKAKNPENKITQLIFDAGFKSIQSYYRNKNS